MIIDGHAHSCGEFYKIEEIINLLDELKVDKVVLCPGVNNNCKRYNIPCLAKKFKKIDWVLFTNKIIRLFSILNKGLGDMQEKNEQVYLLYKKYPDRILQFYWIDLNKDNLTKDLNDKYNLWGFKGLKIHQCFQKFNINSSKIKEVTLFAEKKCIPIFIHLYSKKDIIEFVNLSKEYKNTIFIVAHLVGIEIFEEYSKEMDNVYFDISCTPLISENRIYKAIKAFGAERILLGSDTPFGKDNLKKNIDRVNLLKILDEEKKLILGKNLEIILNIGER